MTNFMLSANIILPLFFLMALGYIMKKIQLLDSRLLTGLNTVVFKVFLPALIIYNVYTSDLSAVFSARLLTYSIICVVLSFFAAMLVIPLIEKDDRKRGVLIQGIFRSNFVIFGVPVCLALYGDEAAGKVAVLIAVIVPLYNFLAVITLEFFKSRYDLCRSDKSSVGSRLSKTLKGILLNPLIISSILGLLILFSGIHLPTAFEKALSEVAKIATPLAFIVLGGSMEFKKIACNTSRIVIGVCGRLIVFPAIFLSVAVALGFRNSELAILLTLFTAPTAVSSFTMAQQAGADDNLAGQLVVFGTVLCLVTVFLWIFIFKQAGLI